MGEGGRRPDEGRACPANPLRGGNGRFSPHQSALRTASLFLFRKNKSAGLLQGKTACFPLWRLAQARSIRQSPLSAIPTKRKFFFREASHWEAYEKRIWSDFKGKVRFPLCSASKQFFRQQRNIHPFRENRSLKPLLFCRGRDSRRASRESLRIKYKKMTRMFFLISEN